jgi:hypothetical protein
LAIFEAFLEENNIRRGELWLNMLIANGLSSLNE